MDKQSLTQERLKELLQYDQETGHFVRVSKSSKYSNNTVGKRAGGIEKHSGYVVIRVDGHLYKGHRLAWLYVYGKFPEHTIDHINGIKHDNRISNLRDVEHSVNCKNRTTAKGYTWHKRIGKWQAQIMVNYQKICLGYFDTEAEARDAYLKERQR